MSGDMEQLIKDKLQAYGFTASDNKKGLFFRRIDENTIIYADFRKNPEEPKFYGYTNRTDEMPRETIDKFTRRIRQELSAIGCITLDKFIDIGEQQPPPVIEKVAAPIGKHCKECNSMAYVPCHKCGEPVCKVCGGEIIDGSRAEAIKGFY